MNKRQKRKTGLILPKKIKDLIRRYSTLHLNQDELGGTFDYGYDFDDRGGLTVKARWFSLDDAIAAMENYADLFREKGTGFVYKVTVSLSDSPSQGTVSVRREKVVEK